MMVDREQVLELIWNLDKNYMEPWARVKPQPLWDTTKFIFLFLFYIFKKNIKDPNGELD